MNKKYVSLSISVFITLVILSMSIFSGSDSSAMSSSVSLVIKNIWDSVFVNYPISIDFLNSLIRKAAHVIEYAILGVSYFFTAKHWNLSILKILLIGLLTASLDEWIQGFVPGRAGSIIDVLLFDFVGFSIGLYLMIIIFDRKCRIHPDDVLSMVENKKISYRKAYRSIYQRNNRLSFTNKAHFVKLRIIIPNSNKLNVFLRILFAIPFPLFLVRFGFWFVKDQITQEFTKTDIIKLISSKRMKVEVKANKGERILIKTI